MRVGVLTGGGDCPGLNAVIRAVVGKGERYYEDDVIGFHDGWKGLLDRSWERLDVARLRGTLPRGGTILGTSRVQPLMFDDGPDQAFATMADLEIDALVAIGGEGTLNVTREMVKRGLHAVGVPKTIDNDIGHTELTFGFDTAVAIATDAIDRLHTTAESHDRVMVVETRVTTLGHVQRGGTPTAFDRVLSTRFGIAAVDAIHDSAWGTMVALRAGQIVRVDLNDATSELKTVDPAIWSVAKEFFA
ncbi:MAG: hypothetical protein GY745_13075 [Actinomycetia bacterium]|nr:hypothetical protein [Actinomycetes bacterium]